MYTIPIIFLVFLFGACKKECQMPINSKFKGKVKSLIEFTSRADSDTTLYFFYYDSLSGDLIRTSKKYYGPNVINSDTATYVFYIEKYNDTIIYIRFSRNVSRNIDKIIVHGKQIVAEYWHDTVSNIDIKTTSVYINNDNNVDSITDVGYGPIYDISFGSFDYDINNSCTNYSAYWTDLILGFPANHSFNYGFTYSTLKNTNMLHRQIPCNILGGFEQGGHFNESTYPLGINGYYLVNTNKYLIDSVLYGYNSVGAYAKYDYTYTNGNITNVTIKTGTIDIPSLETYYQEYTYY